jgi:hypothetical protein
MRRLERIAMLVAGFLATAWGVLLLLQVLVGTDRWPLFLVVGTSLLMAGFRLYRSAGRITV